MPSRAAYFATTSRLIASSAHHATVAPVRDVGRITRAPLRRLARGAARVRVRLTSRAPTRTVACGSQAAAMSATDVTVGTVRIERRRKPRARAWSPLTR